MAHKIVVNKDVCIGCQACTVTCPKSFKMSSDSKAEPINGEVSEITCEKDAETGCPVNAIIVS